MAVDDHGLEVLKKSGEEVTPGSKAEYYIKVKTITGSVFSVSGATTRTRYYIDAPTANTEVSQALSANAKKLTIYVQTLDAASSFSFTSGQSAVAADGTLIPSTCAYDVDGIDITSTTLYIQTTANSKKIIVEEWS